MSKLRVEIEFGEEASAKYVWTDDEGIEHEYEADAHLRQEAVDPESCLPIESLSADDQRAWMDDMARGEVKHVLTTVSLRTPKTGASIG